MEFCNKFMVRADPPPQLWSKTINLHNFFWTLPLCHLTAKVHYSFGALRDREINWE